MCSRTSYFLVLMMALCLIGAAIADPLRQSDDADGIVCVEAENFDENVPQGDHTFELETTQTGYLGTGYMIGLPNSGAGDDPGAGPGLYYEINFRESGTHYLWLRAYAGTDPATGNNDSFHAGLNGTPSAGANAISGFGAAWEWTNDVMGGGRVTIEVPSAGLHTLNIWMREDGSLVDKVILTSNPNYTPTGDGPPESPRGPILNAFAPTPEDGNDVWSKTNALLSWQPGETAVSHDIYFGTSLADVQAGTGGTFRKNQTQKVFMVGFAGVPYPTGLEPGQTYYWRVDEVEAGGTRHKGSVWSFRIMPEIAFNPMPADGSFFISPDVQLEWSAGLNTLLNSVHFGEDFDAVADAAVGTGQVEALPEFDPPELEREKTYYWRVDGLSSTDSTWRKGDVWSFTTAPEGLGEIVMERWEGITTTAVSALRNDPRFPTDPDVTENLTRFYWDDTDIDDYGARIYGWLYVPATGDYTFRIATDDSSELLLSSNEDPEGAELIASISGYSGVNEFTKYGSQTSEPIALQGGRKYYIEALWKEGGGGDHCHVQWSGPGIGDFTTIEGSYLSPFLPVKAYGANPANEAVGVTQSPVLRWKPGIYAASHQLYLGTDADAVANATTGSPEYKGAVALGVDEYQSVELQWGMTYYWRVDEVNNLNPEGPWTGSVWSFTTADYLIIDDMEDYNNFSPFTVWEAWVDGFGNPNNGSQVGYDLGPTVDEGEFYVELNTVHGGSQSMPYFYNNTGNASEATMTLAPGKRDWTQHNLKALRLWYSGFEGSIGGFAETPPGTYRVTGAGADIWNQADEFHYAFKMLNGPGTITARVDELITSNAEPWVKAGLMIRETLDPNSKFAAVYITSGNGCRYQARTETAAGAVSDSSVTTLAHITAPHWIRLERDFSGNFNAFDSNDGVTWFPLAWNPVQITMSPNVYVGFAITSHTPDVPATGVFSNVSTIGTVTGAWQNQDIGIQSNAPEQMYFKLTDGAGRTATVPNPDPNAAQVATWTALGEYGQGIALREFTADNPSLNLANIASMTIGFGPPAGGDGLVFFDDIELHPARCVPQLAKPTFDFSNNCVVDTPDLEIMADQWLLAYEDPVPSMGMLVEAEDADSITDPMQTLSDAEASGGQYIAVASGNNSTGEPPADGIATYSLTVAGGTYKVLARAIADGGDNDSFWLRIQDATTNTTNDSSGWVRWGMVNSEQWAWSPVRSMDDSDQTVEFTMPAGTHTMEVAYREDGALLDRFLITDDLDLDPRTLSPLETDLTNDDVVNFKDYATLIDSWLDEQLWP